MQQGFGSAGPQYHCQDVNECALQFNIGDQPWTDYADSDGGRRRSQDSGGEVSGGGGAETVLGVCDRLTECENLEPGYSCTACPDGMAGSGETGCANDVDECAADPGPCDDGLICVNAIGSYECIAADVDVDECASAPCQNGGICTEVVVDGIDSYTCDCQSPPKSNCSAHS